MSRVLNKPATKAARHRHAAGVTCLNDLFSFDPAEAESRVRDKRLDFPAAERARRRKVNKAARLARRRNR